MTTSAPSKSPLVDQFARRISYLRLSVTDRCDLRCAYCMPERMTFLPRAEVLSLEELHDMALGFIARGITKIRLTGKCRAHFRQHLGVKRGSGIERPLGQNTDAHQRHQRRSRCSVMPICSPISLIASLTILTVTA